MNDQSALVWWRIVSLLALMHEFASRRKGIWAKARGVMDSIKLPDPSNRYNLSVLKIFAGVKFQKLKIRLQIQAGSTKSHNLPAFLRDSL